MMARAQAERADDLRSRGEPFVIATVVRTQRPTSAQTGNVALVRRDGTIDGFVGGVCAQHSVRLYSLKVIETGEPVVLRIVPDPPEGTGGLDTAGSIGGGAQAAGADNRQVPLSGNEIAREDGSVTVRNPCLSGGAIELFLEPVLPPPRVLVAGESPIVAALKAFGSELGLEVVAGVDRLDGQVTPCPGDLALIVAAHGRDEVQALRAGLEAGLAYVGLVASSKRGPAVLADLRAAGVPEHQVARVDSPAGLAIGARTPAEIALSLLAKVVMVRRTHVAEVAPATAAGGALDVIAPGDRPAATSRDESVGRATGGRAHPNGDGGGAPPIGVDPICGMTVVAVPGTPSVQTDEGTIYFCCEGCKLAFKRQRQEA